MAVRFEEIVVCECGHRCRRWSLLLSDQGWLCPGCLQPLRERRREPPDAPRPEERSRRR